MHHYRKTWNKYLSQPRSATCTFCDPSDMLPRIIYETEHAFVIRNRVSYDIWEMYEVLDHLLVIPKQHCRSLYELSDDARHDVMDVWARYEANNYNIYARANANSNRSEPHQHTHLIKTDQKAGHGQLQLRKPYLFVRF